MNNKKITQADIDEALNNAIENGYDEPLELSAEEVALDLIECTQTFEDELPQTLIPFIEDWKKRQHH